MILLGVSRSGTTMLKQMLDQHPAIAIPTESYFVSQLWDRHGDRPDPERFVRDIGRLPRVKEWGVSRDEVRKRLPPEPTFAEAIEAVYRTYADVRGKRRFGDKTPAYMQRLDVLQVSFPGAQYVHLIRDGRDAGLSFVGMRRRPRFNWARPRGLGGFAAQWRREVEGARRFGEGQSPGHYHELRYEDLVADPEPALRDLCGFLRCDFEPGMLQYHQAGEPDLLVDHPRLADPPTPGLRDWREQMAPDEIECFEAIAGELLAALGYGRAYPHPSLAARARGVAHRAALASRIALWDKALTVVRRSPVWRLRQIYIRRTFEEGSTP